MEKDNYALRGFYRPNFFSLFVNGEFSDDYYKITQTDLGTFVHEYTHYLQNVTTVLGLRSGVFYFNYLYEVKKYIEENDKICLPLRGLSFSNVINSSQELFKLYNGTTECINPVYDSVEILFKKYSCNDISVTMICLEFYLNKTKKEEIVLGNNIVKESMAMLCQNYFDNEAKSYLIPYHTIELLCKIINPELLNDKRKIIAICLVALNSQNSGLTLYYLMKKSIKDNSLNGKELYKKYMIECQIVNGGERKTIMEFLLNSIDMFETSLSNSLVADIVYFKLLLKNISIAVKENIHPLLEVLYEKTDRIDQIKSLVDFYGIPHIWSIGGYNFFPIDVNTSKPAMEFIELIGHRIVLDRLLGISSESTGEICTFLSQCQFSEKDLIDENCYEKQWNRDTNCPFKIISDKWSLKEKINCR